MRRSYSKAADEPEPLPNRSSTDSTDETPARPDSEGGARVRTYRWVESAQRGCAEELAVRYGLHPVVARVLCARGWCAGDALERFIAPVLRRTHDPFLMKDMDRACERLAQAVRDREPVLVYGDYDVDGSTATALMVATLRFLNVPVGFYIPDRMSEGYGLNIPALEKLSRTWRLIVTVDTGTSSYAEADWARRHGIELVVTDHHRPGDPLPPAVALVNPNRSDCPYPDKNLSGVGVAFKLAHALLKSVDIDNARAVEFLRSLLDLVAVGTICDMVALTGENRAYVRHGLQVLQAPKRAGFRALKIVSGLEFDQLVTSRHIGFALGPRLNAAGRTSHASTAVELLLETDEHRAFRIAEQLDQFNEERRRIERSILDDTVKQIERDCDVANDKVIVCGGRGWHVGIIGIVASRVLERFGRPAIVCAIDEAGVAKGSGRSLDCFNLFGALSSCSELLMEFGGHTHAAGLRLREEQIPALRASINAIAANELTDDDLVPSLRIDAEVGFDELTFETVAALDDLAPFGNSNTQPLLLLRGVTVDGEPRVVGRNHLKMRVRHGVRQPVEVIGFGQAHHLKTLMAGAREVDLCGTPSINTFRGTSQVQFECRDLRACAT